MNIVNDKMNFTLFEISYSASFFEDILFYLFDLFDLSNLFPIFDS